MRFLFLFCAATCALAANLSNVKALNLAKPGQPLPDPATAAIAPAATSESPADADGRPRESVEVDVSTRTVAVTSSFSGVEILAFGSVENSRQPSAEAGYYDVVVVVSGAPGSAVVRHKSNVAGLWINTDSMKFGSVPSYYAIASSRTLSEIADEKTLHEQAIGFDNLKIRPVQGRVPAAPEAATDDYRAALIRLKQSGGLYINKDYGVTFVGKSLFRATVKLPGNVPVGPLVATTYLFRDGEILNSHATRVTLQREGSERFVYDFAFTHPFFYGVASVLIAIVAGIAASALFQRKTS